MVGQYCTYLDPIFQYRRGDVPVPRWVYHETAYGLELCVTGRYTTNLRHIRQPFLQSPWKIQWRFYLWKKK